MVLVEHVRFDERKTSTTSYYDSVCSALALRVRFAPCASNEVHPIGTFQRKCVAIARRDVDQELWPAPALVLLAVDIKGATGDFSKQQVVRAKQQSALPQTHRGAAITAIP